MQLSFALLLTLATSPFAHASPRNHPNTGKKHNPGTGGSSTTTSSTPPSPSSSSGSSASTSTDCSANTGQDSLLYSGPYTYVLAMKLKAWIWAKTGLRLCARRRRATRCYNIARIPRLTREHLPASTTISGACPQEPVLNASIPHPAAIQLHGARHGPGRTQPQTLQVSTTSKATPTRTTHPSPVKRSATSRASPPVGRGGTY